MVQGFTRWGTLPLAAFLAALGSASGASLQRFQYTELHMGVQARIVLYAATEDGAARAAKAAFARIAALDAAMSDYRPDSELMRLCNRAGQQAVPVSTDLLRVLTASTDLASRTDGAFDATVGPIVRLWRQARRTRVLPSPGDLAAARALVGWRHVHIDRRASTVSLRLPGMRLDLGGIAKGYALDRAIEALRAQGIRSALADMGGDIAAAGPPPGQSAWVIRIDNAEPDGSARTVRIAQGGVSTSGDTEQYVEIGGTRYSHVVDPHTGLGLTDRIAVTVIAPCATLSDGLSTALSVMGERRGSALAARIPGVTAIIRRIGAQRLAPQP